MQRWRDGLGRDPGADADWVDYVGGLRQRGIRFERVRMVTDPPTEYLRMQIDYSTMNVAAGEDLRWIPGAVASRLGVPGYDFYVFDDRLVAELVFDATGQLSAVLTTGDQEVVNKHCAWRNLIWSNAIPHDQYIQSRKAL